MSLIGLVGCSQRKLEHSAAARELYISETFRLSKQLAETYCDKWYVYSGLQHLIRPDVQVEPYDEYVGDWDEEARAKWSAVIVSQLGPYLQPNDVVVLLARDALYTETIAILLQSSGYAVVNPYKGLSREACHRWATSMLSRNSRSEAVDSVYTSLERLSKGLGGKVTLGDANGKMKWPKRGVYFFFDSNEYRVKRESERVVRVGTHAVSTGSKSSLWTRLRTHRGTATQGGNHRSSIFRLHVGSAFRNFESHKEWPASWGQGMTAPPNIRASEQDLERRVSQYIGALRMLWIDVPDEASSISDRAFIEQNVIGLLSGPQGPLELPTNNWLGLWSTNTAIRRSLLWNVDYTDRDYNQSICEVLDTYVSVTLGEIAAPHKPLAPDKWHVRNQSQGTLGI